MRSVASTQPVAGMPSFYLLLQALRASWGPDTAVAPDAYSTDNPARGQCVSSSLVVQDYYGGDIRRCRTHYEGHHEAHYRNLLPNGKVLDATKSQYQLPVRLTPAAADLRGFTTLRDKQLHDPDIRHQYLTLRKRVQGYLEARQQAASSKATI